MKDLHHCTLSGTTNKLLWSATDSLLSPPCRNNRPLSSNGGRKSWVQPWLLCRFLVAQYSTVSPNRAAPPLLLHLSHQPTTYSASSQLPHSLALEITNMVWWTWQERKRRRKKQEKEKGYSCKCTFESNCIHAVYFFNIISDGWNLTGPRWFSF